MPWAFDQMHEADRNQTLRCLGCTACTAFIPTLHSDVWICPKLLAEPYTPNVNINVHFLSSSFLDICFEPSSFCVPFLWLQGIHKLRKAMMNILEELDEDHCKCPYGAAGKEAGWDFDQNVHPAVGEFHLVPRRNFKHEGQHHSPLQGWNQMSLFSTACTKTPQLHESFEMKGGGVSPHPEIRSWQPFWNSIWDKSPNMNCWFLFARNLNPLSQVGYSCPGTSLDWIYDKLQSSDAGNTCMLLQVSSWLKERTNNTTKQP